MTRPLPDTKESLLNSWRVWERDADIVVECKPHPVDYEREALQAKIVTNAIGSVALSDRPLRVAPDQSEFWVLEDSNGMITEVGRAEPFPDDPLAPSVMPRRITFFGRRA